MTVDLVEQIRQVSGNRQLWSVTPEIRLDDKSERELETLLWSDPEGCLSVSVVDDDEFVRYRFRQDERFSVDLLAHSELVVHVRADVSPQTIDHFIADQVIPRAMAGEGQYVLHSAAVRHADQAILVMGASGRGKSTLATSFHLAGADILGDDAVLIGWRENVPFASAVYRSLRLLPDSIEALLPEAVETEAVADYTSKRRVSVPKGKEEMVAPLPIAAMFMIAETGDPTRPEIRELKTGEACMALVENAFALDPTDTGSALERLEKASALARSVPSFAIDYPRNYSALPAVRAAILDRLR